MTRGVLYYPTMNITDRSWLRQAVLYNDKIASIVPSGMEDQFSLNPDIQTLIHEKMFEPLHTYVLFQNNFARQDFLNDIINIFDSAEFQTYFKSGPKQYDSKVHIEKLNQEVTEFLKTRHLIDLNPQKGPWYYFERRSALLYMATLAKHVARTEPGFIPSTAVKQYHDFLYRKNLNSDGLFCTQILLPKLPEPRENVSIDQIIEFKKRHRLELDNLQSQIRNFELKIREAESIDSINDIGNQFGETIEYGLQRLEENCRRDSIDLKIGSLTTFLESKPGLWEAVIGAASLGVGAICPPVGVGIVILYGGIRVGAYVIRKKNENFMKLQDDPLSFLYNAKTENII